MQPCWCRRCAARPRRGLARWTTAAAVVRSVHGGAEHACTVQLRETGLVLPRVPIAVGILGAAALPERRRARRRRLQRRRRARRRGNRRLYDENTAPPDHGPARWCSTCRPARPPTTPACSLTVEVPGDGTRSATLTLGGSVAVGGDGRRRGVVLTAGEASLTLQQTSSSDGTATLEVGGSSVAVEQGGDVTIEGDRDADAAGHQRRDLR